MFYLKLLLSKKSSTASKIGDGDTARLFFITSCISMLMCSYGMSAQADDILPTSKTFH